MGNRVTLVLAVALTAASLFAWFDPKTRKAYWSDATSRPTGSIEDTLKPLLEFAPTAVEAMHLRYGTLNLRTRREGGGWSGVVRPDRVEDFLVSLSEMVQIMTMEASPDDLVDFGLDPPAGVVALEFRDAPAIQLLVGSRNPSGTAIYVRVGHEGDVVLTGALLPWELDKLTRTLNEGER